MKKNRGITYDQLPEQWKAQVDAQISSAGPNMEPSAGSQAAPENAPQALDTPYYISVRCVTKRAEQSDPDNICIKWILDELVTAGLLLSDTAKDVQRISFERVKGEPEETIIEVWEE